VDRRSVIRAALAAVIAIAAGLALATCSNPIDIVNAIKTEVMVANNRFLLVSDMGPFAENDQAVNPGSVLWIKFDRGLDPSSVTPACVAFDPPVSWTPLYNDATKTLTILPYFANLTTYTVTVGSGLKASDGSELQNPYVFSFRTKDGPTGNLTINTLGDIYTTNPAVTLNFDYNFVTSQIRWSQTETEITSDPAAGNQGLWKPKAASFTSVNLGSDGVKTVYYQLVDASGNSTPGYDGQGSHPRSATITLDSQPPTFVSLSINGGVVYSTSTVVTINSNVTDAAPSTGLQMRFQNKNGAWSAWETYSATKTWYLSAYGTRTVTAEYRDLAGNVASNGTPPYADTIIAGAPTLYVPINDHKAAGVGKFAASWTITPPDTGTDTYYVSWRPWNTTTWSALVNTALTSLDLIRPAGALYDFAVQIGNPAAGAYSAASAPYSNVRPAFSSDIAILYNDGDSVDTTLAQNLRGILKDNPAWIGPSGTTGSLPSWTITLVPDKFVPSRYRPPDTVVFAYPLFITPGSMAYKNTDWVLNLAGSGRTGIIAMGDGGAYLLDVVNQNWKVIASGQQPLELGTNGTRVEGTDDSVFAAGDVAADTAIWATPLMPNGTPSLNGDGYTLGVALVSYTHRYAKNYYPALGAVYSMNYKSSGDFNVLRQGRFAQYGFSALPRDVVMSNPLLVNLASRMGESYFR
jgi:hypothetical protein